MIELGKSEHGHDFPIYQGKLLSWTLELTLDDEQAGFPKLRFMVNAMRQYRPEQLKRERIEMLKRSFDRVFGHNARKVLSIIEQENKPEFDYLPIDAQTGVVVVSQ